MVENPHRLQSLNGSSESIRLNESTLVGLSINNGTSNLLATADNITEPLYSGPHVFRTSEKSIRAPLISQEKFHWTQVSNFNIYIYIFVVSTKSRTLTLPCDTIQVRPRAHSRRLLLWLHRVPSCRRSNGRSGRRQMVRDLFITFITLI